MDEREWVACGDPDKMLDHLRGRVKASERKMRLLAPACCRRLWPLLVHEISRTCVAIAERYADGLATVDALNAVSGEAERSLADAWHGPLSPWHEARAAMAVSWACEDAPPAEATEGDIWFQTRESMAEAAGAVADRKAYVGPPFICLTEQPDPNERRHQADILRDIFGPLPFRPVTLPPSVRKWNDGTIPKLAEAAYQERSLPSGELDRHRLAVLADALEEVGADDLLLEHLRGPGPRVRGDWLIDMLTSRE